VLGKTARVVKGAEADGAVVPRPDGRDTRTEPGRRHRPRSVESEAAPPLTIMSLLPRSTKPE